MKVALDVTPLLGVRTGVGQVVHQLLPHLVDRPGLSVLPWALSLRALGSRYELPPDTVVLPLPASMALRAWAKWDRPRGDRWLGGADVVHGTNFVAPPMRRTPAVITVHDCWCARFPERCQPDAVLAVAAMRRAIARGAWVHVSTEVMAKEVAELFGTERTAVVPFGVPAVSGPTGPPPVRGPYVLALGSLDHRKGYPTLIRSFGMLKENDLRLALAGPDGPAASEVKAAIAALEPSVAARVELLGHVTNDVRRALLAGATLLAYPSLYEGFGFPMLEAMALGVPVVATSAGAIPEVVADAASLVPVDDPEALAAALGQVLTDRVLRAKLIAAGRARAGQLTWERTADGLVDLWERTSG